MIPYYGIAASPATVLKAINVEHRDGLRVVIAADGELTPNVFAIGSDRIVVDLPGVVSLTRRRVIAVNDPLLKRVRIGQHPEKVRVVLDLHQATHYEMERGDGRLVVMLGHQETTTAPIPPPLIAPTVPPVADHGDRIKRADHGDRIRRAAPGDRISMEEQHSSRPASRQAATAAPVQPEGPGATGSVPATEAQAAEPTEQRLERGEEQTHEDIGKKQYPGRPISLDFEEADLKAVLRVIADASEEKFVISDDVAGKVSLSLHDVPWDQAMELVLKTNGLGMQEVANIRRIAPLGTIARIQEEEAKAMELSLKVGDLLTRVIPVGYAKAEQVATIIKKSLTTRGSVEVDVRTNAIIVKDTAAVVREVADLAKTLDTATPQIMIEARMVQAKPSFARGLGVQWGGGYSSRSGEFGIQAQGVASGAAAFGAFSPNFVVNLPSSPTVGAIGAVTVGRLAGGTMTLDLRLSAGETQGLTKIVSAPRVMVLDNMEAKISQGESIPFQTVSQAGTQVQFLDAALSLSVTPHVTSSDTVQLKIEATKNAPGDVVPGVGTRILKKEARTQVIVKDGETVVIGGIFEIAKSQGETRVPLLHRIPIIGWLFKSKTETEDVSELLVFVTPRIVR